MKAFLKCHVVHGKMKVFRPRVSYFEAHRLYLHKQVGSGDSK